MYKIPERWLVENIWEILDITNIDWNDDFEYYNLCAVFRHIPSVMEQILEYAKMKISINSDALINDVKETIGDKEHYNDIIKRFIRNSCEKRARNKEELEMQVIDYFNCDRQEYWLCQIKKCDWGAGQYLYQLLSEDKFKNAVGENSKVLLLTKGDELVSFCTYAEKDDIQPTELTPWIGFVYTFPEYRGNRFVGKLFMEIEKIAKNEEVHDIFISTNHIGLYEKYGCEFYQVMNDMNGEPSRVYRKHIG